MSTVVVRIDPKLLTIEVRKESSRGTEVKAAFVMDKADVVEGVNLTKEVTEIIWNPAAVLP